MGGDGEVAFDDDVAVALAGFPEFADGGVGDAIGQDDVRADEFDGLETTEGFRQRSSADFLGRRSRRARIGQVDLRPGLPTGNDRMAEPEFALRLRGRELTAERLTARVMVGAGREGFVADAFAAPDRRDPEQVGVKAGPGIVRQLDDQPSRGEVILAGAFATGVEDRGEEREIGFDPLAPRLRGVGLRFAAFPSRGLLRRFRRKAGQRSAKEGKDKTIWTHGEEGEGAMVRVWQLLGRNVLHRSSIVYP